MLSVPDRINAVLPLTAPSSGGLSWLQRAAD